MAYPPQDHFLPPRIATLFVAASDATDRERAQADYLCDGVADDVQINMALAALIGGGKVILSTGQFVLSESILIVNSETILEGQGWSSYLEGIALATGDHAIQISGSSECQVRNLSIQTLAGAGNTVHCIYIEDGANDFKIIDVYFRDSDSDCIHIEGTSINRGEVAGCFIEGADDNGINISMDGGDQSANFNIHNNHIFSCGLEGINFGACAGHYYHVIVDNIIGSCADNGIDYGAVAGVTTGLMESIISGNVIRGCTFNGIRLRSDSDNNLIENNSINGCGGYGINIGDASCTDNRVMNNKLIGNVAGAIQDSGTLTHTPHIFIPVPNPSTNIGAHPAEQLTDELEVLSRIEFYLPEAFQELLTAHMIVVPGGTGNLRRSVAANWGGLASGETYNVATGTVAEGNVAVNSDWLEAIDISAALAGPPVISQRDVIGVAFTRHADDVLDTVGADCYLLGIMLRYV
ncbi:MAG: right-handed parallel beta-helix repeat-containing protein [Dehalococcoidia bacterium]|jgi:parallel beta-helix repeat protein